MSSLFKTLHPVSLMPTLIGDLKLVPSPQSLYRADIFAWMTPSDSAPALPVTMHNVRFSTRATLVISSFIRAKNFLPCGWLHLDCNCMYLQTRFHVPRQNSRPFQGVGTMISSKCSLAGLRIHARLAIIGHRSRES